MHALQRHITDAVKTAMKSGDKPRLAVLRLMTAALKQYEVDQRQAPDDNTVIAILDKMGKQRRESITQYRKAQREDLVQQEEFELTIISEYLPQALSADELEQLINAAITETGAASMQDMGAVMGRLKPQVQGRTDMSQLSKAVRQRLSS